ncbi:Phosphoethanolamine transferase OpgE [Campylobacter majalis]|uniref:Phosphoethanolamine transferase OpgE n=2 Tax=Campylobacter majalis TaxID=2790656 RepID=A0ABN7K259_9BACT|nr:Phosphoethanolamine transferase OpgE [Campylobacter majalis]
MGGGWKLYLNVAYLAFATFIFINFRYLFWIVFFPFILLLSIYAPVGMIYGGVDESFLLALFGTYGGEAREFFGSIDIRYLLSTIFSVFFIIYLRVSKTSSSIKFPVAIFIIFAIATATGKLWGIASTSSVITMLKDFKSSYEYFKKTNIHIVKPKWIIKSIDPKYHNYVVVIGESARRDYHGVYGYNINNTPFLSSVDGVIIDGFNAVGLNTIPTLRATLNHERDFDLNIVDLANLAGFKTFWVSNQGFLGTHETDVSIVAKRANFSYFSTHDKINASHKGEENHDKILIPQIAKILNQQINEKRVIFVHLYGSHPDACRRISNNDYVKYSDKATFNINCYVESIRETDENLRQIYNLLKQNFDTSLQSFSMIYFSDHGLTHDTSSNQIKLGMHSSPAKQHLQIPLIKISSDDKTRQYIKNESYQNNFAQSFAKWLGVKVLNFSTTSDIFEPIIQDDITNSKRLIKNKNDDLAIDISKFKKN